MTRSGTVVACAVVFAGTVFIGACSEPSHERNEHYVFVATNINLPYWKEAEAGFLDSAKTLGVTAELVGPTGYSPNAELQAFRQVVEQQPAGICLSAARPELFQADIDKAVGARHPGDLCGFRRTRFEAPVVHRDG